MSKDGAMLYSQAAYNNMELVKEHGFCSIK